MDNSFFIFSSNSVNDQIKIERAHICTWEFKNNSTLVEFGFEISKSSLPQEKLCMSLFIPWLTQSKIETDLYERLCKIENSRFIFNDSIEQSKSLDGGRNKLGVIYNFSNREPLCILPVGIQKMEDNTLKLNVDLAAYRTIQSETNIYFRFSITPRMPTISMQKNGISKSTIVYDIKINEPRNIPDEMISYLSPKRFCKINTCFCFFIVPNTYDIVFFENEALKSVRTLEYNSFIKYLDDKRVKKDELMVVFNKKKGMESFSFFTIFTKERIGPGQYVLAILVNMISGILLFLPGFREGLKKEISIWPQFPMELLIAAAIMITTLLYFLWPKITALIKMASNLFKRDLN